MPDLLNALVRVPIDTVGRTVVRRVNTPMGPLLAAGVGALAGISVANRVGQDGLFSLKGGGAVAFNTALGAYMLGVGKVYAKPYFTSLGTVMLAATAVGTAIGVVNSGRTLIPELDVSIRVRD